jgi:hypothetical protein
MVSFFSEFTNLKKLHFSSDNFKSSLPEPSAQKLALPYLEELSLRHDGSGTLVVAFWEAFHLPKLQRMSCGYLPLPLPRHIAAFGQLINGSGQCFSLEFCVDNDYWTEAASGRTPWSKDDISGHLRQCPSVKNLSVTCNEGTGFWSKSVGETLSNNIFG